MARNSAFHIYISVTLSFVLIRTLAVLWMAQFPKNDEGKRRRERPKSDATSGFWSMRNGHCTYLLGLRAYLIDLLRHRRDIKPRLSKLAIPARRQMTRPRLLSHGRAQETLRSIAKNAGITTNYWAGV